MSTRVAARIDETQSCPVRQSDGFVQWRTRTHYAAAATLSLQPQFPVATTEAILTNEVGTIDPFDFAQGGLSIARAVLHQIDLDPGDSVEVFS
jgi:hypothetical protein